MISTCDNRFCFLSYNEFSVFSSIHYFYIRLRGYLYVRLVLRPPTPQYTQLMGSKFVYGTSTLHDPRCLKLSWEVGGWGCVASERFLNETKKYW